MKKILLSISLILGLMLVTAGIVVAEAQEKYNEGDSVEPVKAQFGWFAEEQPYGPKAQFGSYAPWVCQLGNTFGK